MTSVGVPAFVAVATTAPLVNMPIPEVTLVASPVLAMDFPTVASFASVGFASNRVAPMKDIARHHVGGVATTTNHFSHKIS